MSDNKINVGFFYRVLPHYRLPIMEELAKRPEIDLTVLYSKEPSWYSLKTVNPNGRFKSELIEMRAWRLGNQEILYQPDASRLIKSGRFDVVILPGNPRLLSNFPALWAANKQRVGVVWWSLGLMANQSPVTIAIRRWLMHIPDAVVLYTTDERDYFVSRGVPPEKVFIAQNTIDVTAERSAANAWNADLIDDFLAENGLSGKTLFLFCARLRKIKRVDLLLRAMSILLRDRPDIHLVIIGEGELEVELKELAGQLRLDGSISWLGSIYEPQRLAPWYLSSKALVIPTGIGLAAFQSFAYGLPCITTSNRHKQSPEASALLDGYNCLMFEDESIGDMAEKMRLLASDKDLQQRLSVNARRTMEEEYTVERMVDGFVQAIQYAHEKVKTD
jgi:glycosyltransferase involved in cell wall biosynthesis